MGSLVLIAGIILAFRDGLPKPSLPWLWRAGAVCRTCSRSWGRGMSRFRVRGRQLVTVAGVMVVAVVLAVVHQVRAVGFDRGERDRRRPQRRRRVGRCDGQRGQDPLVVTSDGKLTHLLPCGDGCYTRGESVPVGTVALGWPVVSADFNSDAIEDVVTSSSAGVVVYFGGARARPGPPGSSRRFGQGDGGYGARHGHRRPRRRR